MLVLDIIAELYFMQNPEEYWTTTFHADPENNPDFQADMDRLYKLRLGEDFIKNKYGVCWDFCELEREFFEGAGIEHECYYVEAFEDRHEGGPTHTFALFKEDAKWKWFEYSWGLYMGIWEYESKEKALADIVEKFRVCSNDANPENLKLFKTNKIKNRLDTFKFVEHCYKGIPIEIPTK